MYLTFYINFIKNRYILQKKKKVNSYLGEPRPLSSLLWSIYSFWTLDKWLEVLTHPKMNVGTLGTFILQGTKTPIFILMVHIFIWEPLRKNWRLFPTLESKVHPKDNLVHPILELNIRTPISLLMVHLIIWGP